MSSRIGGGATSDYEDTCDNAWPCEWEYEAWGEDWGWIHADDWTGEEYFVTGDDWMENFA